MPDLVRETRGTFAAPAIERLRGILRRRHLRGVALATPVVVLLGFAGACSDTLTPFNLDESGISPGSASFARGGASGQSITITPQLDTLRTLGQTVQLSAWATNPAGKTKGVAAVWASDDSSVATVNPGGLVTARGSGNARITATARGRTATAEVFVRGGGKTTAARVELSRSELLLAQGETTTLTATVKDGSGNLLSDVSVTWSSTDDATATVDSRGKVTARASGHASIRAAAKGQAGYVRVQVTQGPTPAPPGAGGGGAWPNEPAGFVRWAEHDFSSLPGARGTSLIYGTASSDYGSNYSIVSDPRASSGKALRIQYPKGLPDGHTPGRFFVRNPGKRVPLKEWYVSLWVMLEGANWENPPANLKLWYNGSNRGGSVHLNHGGATRELATAFRTRFTARPCKDCVIVNFSDELAGSRKTFQVGQWHHIEFHGTLSTPGVQDGTYRMWIDGQLVNERHDVQNQHPNDWTDAFDDFHWAPVWGGACSNGCPKRRTDFMRLGHLYISGVAR
jgi:hypothetical protein